MHYNITNIPPAIGMTILLELLLLADSCATTTVPADNTVSLQTKTCLRVAVWF